MQDDEDVVALLPLVSENAAVRNPVVFFRTKEFAIQPPQMVQLIGERHLSQNGGDKVN